MDELKKKDLGVRAMQNFAVNVNIDVHCMGGTYRLHERMLQQECAEDGLLFWSIRPHRFEHKIINDEATGPPHENACVHHSMKWARIRPSWVTASADGVK